MRQLLRQIYGQKEGELAYHRIQAIIESIPARRRDEKSYFSQEDIYFITYGDILRSSRERPLTTLHRFASRHLKGVFTTIHFLPFFPYSSDDGFSVLDYFSINPELGTWSDVRNFDSNFGLMFDYVLNHISAQSQWFNNYLAGRRGYDTLAIEMDPSTDFSQVTRPRSSPLLTEFKKQSGDHVHLWTTFSADQVDLNYASIDILEKMIEVLLFYVAQGATAIRLDAIAYLWKTVGTACIHLDETHEMVRLFRQVLDQAAPEVLLITETNVPHAENISYLGDGQNEAQMVYNFTLPPLLLHTFFRADARVLSEWAKRLYLPSEKTTFFNFTASHDGIGVRPLEGILPQKDIDQLIQTVEKNGGFVAYKQNSDGTQSPYELNVTYIDALGTQNDKKDSHHIARFLASQVIQYVLPGVPATYIHSLLGSRNWHEGVQQTGRPRSINREKLDLDRLEAELADPMSFRSKIFFPYLDMIKIRKAQPAFHPKSAFEVILVDPKIFCIIRSCPQQTIYALTNISPERVSISLSFRDVPEKMKDLLSGQTISADSLKMQPYQSLWLEDGKTHLGRDVV